METAIVDGFLLKKYVAYYSATAYFEVEVWAEDEDHAREQINSRIIEPHLENMTDFDSIEIMSVGLV